MHLFKRVSEEISGLAKVGIFPGCEPPCGQQATRWLTGKPQKLFPELLMAFKIGHSGNLKR